MQNYAMRLLGASFYDEDVIEAFIASVGTMDDSLIDEGGYSVVVLDGQIVGSGGWSMRAPGYASHAKGGDAAEMARKATVRSVFVHPDFARRGIARGLMDRVERQILAAGFTEASLAATLSGIPLYRRLGWRSRLPVVLSLPDGLAFVGLAMTKRLATNGNEGALSAA